MVLQKIEIIRGDTDSIAVLFTEHESGDPMDITGWEIRFTVREQVPETSVTDDTTAIIAKSVTGDNTGKVLFELSSDDTDIDIKYYLYDIQYKKPDGTVKTLGVSDFVIKEDITRSQ